MDREVLSAPQKQTHHHNDLHMSLHHIAAWRGLLRNGLGCRYACVFLPCCEKRQAAKKAKGVDP
jgi:hypothetical protein